MSCLWEENESETESLSSSGIGSAGDESVESSRHLMEEDWLSYSGGWQSEGEAGKSPAMSLHSLTHQEGVKLIHLRKHVGMLQRNVDDCRLEVTKLRDGVASCQKKQLDIVAELMRLDDEDTPTTMGLDFRQLHDDQPDGNRKPEPHLVHGRKAGQGLLQGKRNKLKAQMYEEKEGEENMKVALTAAEERLLEAEMTARELEGLEASLEKGEAALKKSKDRKLARRLEAEANLVATARKQSQTVKALRKSSSEELLRDVGELEQQREAAMKRVLDRQREAQRRTQQEEQLHVEKRMSAILSLKKNIAASEDIIQAQSLLHKEKKQRKAEEQKRQILEEGGDLLMETIRRNRIEQFQKKMDEFHRKQDKKKMEIVAKLLKEEESIKQRGIPKLPLPPVLDTRRRKRKRRKRKEKEGEESRKRSGSAPTTDSRKIEDEIEERLGNQLFEGSDTTTGENKDEGSPDKAQEIAAVMEPEIGGIWVEGAASPKQGEAGKPPAIWRPRSLSSKRSEEVEESSAVKKRIFSTAELRIMQTTLDKLRKGIIRKQVAAGREFKGVAFTSQPAVVLFQDFDVGQTYSKNLKLTNVSYTVNHCRLVGVSPSLVDSISVNFDPPGAMSAGMMCQMLVKFEPQLEEDTDGEIQLLSETGSFGIPVRCRTKKCQIKLDHTHLDFGKVCIGETARRHVTIYNTGALSTKYFLSRSHDRCYSPSPVIMSEGSESSVLIAGKLADKSDLSLKSDLGMYGRPLEEMQKLALGSEEYNPMSKSVNSFGTFMADTNITANSTVTATVTDTSDGIAANKNEVTDQSAGGCTNTDGLPSRDGPRTSTRSTARDGHASRGILRVSSGEGGTNKDGQTSKTGQSSKDGRTSGVQFTDMSPEEAGDGSLPAQSLPGTNSGSSITVQEPAPSSILFEGSPQGALEGFSSQTWKFVFSPKAAEPDINEYFISFSATLPILKVRLVGAGVEVPVYLEQEQVDMKICLVDRLYQCAVVLHNRAATARPVLFKIPAELQAYLEVLPANSMVQGNDSLSVQLKFCPGQPLLQSGSARDQFSGPGNCWKMDIRVDVGGQTLPVILTVLAELSPSALVLAPEHVDFGSCTTQETVTQSVSLTNTSSLTQSFGFVHIPPFMDVQPGDGFGHILPGETIQLDLLFSPDKSKDYKFEVTFKSLLNQTIKVLCKGRGVLAPMVLSGSQVIFPPTRLGSTSRVNLTITNSRLSKFSSAVIRGTAPAQGTRAFHFSLPPDTPLSITPHTGVLQLGQSVTIEVSLSPRLTNKMAENAHLRMLSKKRANEAAKAAIVIEETEFTHAVTISGKAAMDAAKKANPRQTKVSSKAGQKARDKRELPNEVSLTDSVKMAELPMTGGRRKNITNVLSPGAGRGASLAVGSSKKRASPSSTSTVASRPPSPGSGDWWNICRLLLTQYKDTDISHTIPCFVSEVISSTEISDTMEGLKHCPDYTLYVEVVGRIVRPELILTKGQTPNVNFGRVGTGQTGKQKVVVENRSDETLKVWSSVLDPLGPFSLRNALRPIPPNCTHTLILHFSPQAGTKTYDTLMLYYGESASCLELNLIGEGLPLDVIVAPQSSGPEGTETSLVEDQQLTCLDLGHIMARDTASKTFELRNNSPLPIQFSFSMVSQMPESRHVKKERGICSSGHAPFTCVPNGGTLDGEQVKDVKVIFDPDRQTSFFSDKILVKFNGKVNSTVDIIGRAWNSNMYVLLSDTEADPSCSNSSKTGSTHNNTTETLVSPSSAGPQPQTLVVVFTYSSSSLHLAKSAATTLPQLSDKVSKTASDVNQNSKEQPSQDKDKELTGIKSGSSQSSTTTQQVLSKTQSSTEHTPGKVAAAAAEEEQASNCCKRELVIGCIKSSLVKKQSGDFVIEPLNAASNPTAKCFTIDPLKATVEGGGTRVVSVSFVPPKSITRCIEASTTMTVKGDSSQSYQLCLRAVVTE